MPRPTVLLFDPDPVRCARSVDALADVDIDVLAFDAVASLRDALQKHSPTIVFAFGGHEGESNTDSDDTPPLAALVAAIAQVIDATPVAQVIDATPVAQVIDATSVAQDIDATPVARVSDATSVARVSDATQVAQGIDESEPAEKANVYAFSSNGSVEEAVSCIRQGALDYIALGEDSEKSIAAVAATALSAINASPKKSEKPNASGEGSHGVDDDSVDNRSGYDKRLLATAQGTRHFANCSTFPELATQALAVMRTNLDATGGALFLLESNHWRMMHAADLAHDFVLEASHDLALEQHFAGRNAASEGAGDGPLSRFLRKRRGALAAFALRSPEGALLGLLLLHRPTEAEFDQRDVELGRLVLAHVTEALKSIRLTDSLRKSEERFHSIASNVPGVVFQARCGLGEIVKFTYISDSSTEVFGIRPERFLFTPVVFLERVVVDDLPALLRLLREAVSTLSPWKWEGRILGHGDKTRWIQLSARPSIEPGAPDNVIYNGLMLDITDAKELEFQLQLADRMVSVGTLAAGVAHEINNPLTYVLANLGLIREELEDLERVKNREELRSLLDEASEGAERVTQIVRDLKVFSRGDEQRANVAISIERVLESSLNMATNELRHRARIERQFQTTPFVRANHARLGQVFINLLINAAQAIPEGHADENLIRISTGTDDDGRAIVSIEDTGTGIPEEARKRIFDPFFTTKPVGVGTGLGLPICHRIIDEIGGEISVASAPGRGSTFTVVLPPCEATEAEIDAEESGNNILPHSRARVLIVDDEEGVVSALKRGLRNHEIVTALGGRSALEALQQNPSFDVVLCDLMMPDFSGIDLFDEIQTTFPQLTDRVVFMTGGAFTTRAKKFLNDTPNSHISKPFLLREIESLIRSKIHALRPALPVNDESAANS